MNQFLTYFIPLLGSFFSSASDLYIPCIALGLLCAMPSLVRRIVDFV